MSAADAGIAQAADAVEVSHPAGHQEVHIVRANEFGHPREVRRRAAVREDEPPHAGADELADEARRPSPAGRRDASGKAASRSGRGSSPTASQSPGDRQALAQVVRTVGDRRRQHDTGRAGREREADAIGGVHAAGQLERDPDARRDRHRPPRG